MKKLGMQTLCCLSEKWWGGGFCSSLPASSLGPRTSSSLISSHCACVQRKGLGLGQRAALRFAHWAQGQPNHPPSPALSSPLPSPVGACLVAPEAGQGLGDFPLGFVCSWESEGPENGGCGQIWHPLVSGQGLCEMAGSDSHAQAEQSHASQDW